MRSRQVSVQRSSPGGIDRLGSCSKVTVPVVRLDRGVVDDADDVARRASGRAVRSSVSSTSVGARSPRRRPARSRRPSCRRRRCRGRPSCPSRSPASPSSIRTRRLAVVDPGAAGDRERVVVEARLRPRVVGVRARDRARAGRAARTRPGRSARPRAAPARCALADQRPRRGVHVPAEAAGARATRISVFSWSRSWITSPSLPCAVEDRRGGGLEPLLQRQARARSAPCR